MATIHEILAEFREAARSKRDMGDKFERLGERLCRTPEQFKAWSQNLGHEGVLTTLFAYGTVPTGRQREIMVGFEAYER